MNIARCPHRREESSHNARVGQVEALYYFTENEIGPIVDVAPFLNFTPHHVVLRGNENTHLGSI